jgi:hypothetical protein
VIYGEEDDSLQAGAVEKDQKDEDARRDGEAARPATASGR